MMTMVMLGRLWCGGDDGSGYDIVGMVVMICDEDGGGGMMKVATGCRDGDVGGCNGGDAAVAASVVAIGVAVDDGSGGVIVVRGMVMVAAGMLANNLKVLPMLNAPDQTSDPRKGGDCDDGSGYDIVGMVVMICDEDGGGVMMKVAADCGDGDVGGCSGGDAAVAAAVVAIGVAVDDGSGGVAVVRGMVMVAAG
ncbi:hypothetical protein Tco_0874841 [Tanacetum coccineum]|uniref:Uncharacterized protein n=1 Tax=Tanacetum coccineum TaxID=301880 RepID=A0ABQ5BMQ7_9ASTR